MMDSTFAALSFRLLAACIGAAFLNGCASPPVNPGGPGCVRRVDFSQAPEMKVLAERARQTGNRMYPKVAALLAAGCRDFPGHFDICVKKQLVSQRVAETRLTEICLDAGYLPLFKEDPDAFDQMLVHEMAHVAQRYYRPILGGWVIYDPRPPACWEEGIAEYACFKLGQTNGWSCPECSFAYPHYRYGYSCAGAFLLYLDNNYNSNIVRQLNAALRHGGYSDAFFTRATGKD